MGASAISGRPPKPTAIKQVDGSKRINDKEPKYPLVEVVDAPSHLDRNAKKAWRYYSELLVKAGVLTTADLHNLEAFCAAYSRWRQAERTLRTEGFYTETRNGSKTRHPAHNVVQESLTQMRQFGAALGLDPASRSKLVVGDGGSDNPFADL